MESLILSCNYSNEDTMEVCDEKGLVVIDMENHDLCDQYNTAIHLNLQSEKKLRDYLNNREAERNKN